MHGKTKQWSGEDKAGFLQEGEELNEAFVMAIQKNCSLNPMKFKLWFAGITLGSSAAGCQQERVIWFKPMYQASEFKNFFEGHPELLDFTVEAMKEFVETELN